MFLQNYEIRLKLARNFAIYLSLLMQSIDVKKEKKKGKKQRTLKLHWKKEKRDSASHIRWRTCAQRIELSIAPSRHSM